jgi:hypothetical protein
MGATRPRDRELLALLAEHDLVVEVGAKHWLIKTRSGQLVGTWPRSGRSHAKGATRKHRNLIAQIRRAARG